MPFTTRFAIGDMNNWFPIPPQQVWHFRQSIDYSITANRAILDYASRDRELLLPHLSDGPRRDQVGQRRSLDVHAARVGQGRDWPRAARRSRPWRRRSRQAGVTLERAAAAASGGGGGGRGGGACGQLYAALTTKELRDPRGFIIPSDQPDFGTAVRFINALIKSGITVLQAAASFTVSGKPYPANSLVVKTAQAFRPHVMDMFEPQDHPDDIPYPGAPPTAPYDNAGYTLAFQMGVQFDRILDGSTGRSRR